MDLSAAIDGIAKLAEKNIKVNENDYIGTDGLLVCGNCNTPKQVRVIFLGQEKTPYCMCKCEAEKREQDEKQSIQSSLSIKIARNKANAFPDVNVGEPAIDDVRCWTFEKDDGKNERLSRAARKYSENFKDYRSKGQGLLLYGSVGTGKSFMAGCITNAVLEQGYSAMMTSFSRIEKTLFGITSGKQEYIDNLNKYSLLVLDDFGVERSSEYMQEIVYNVIDGRNRVNLPLIVTSNLTSQELKSPVGIQNQRIYSRILEKCHPIHVPGDDRRKQKAVSRYAEMEKMLGL